MSSVQNSMDYLGSCNQYAFYCRNVWITAVEQNRRHPDRRGFLPKQAWNPERTWRSWIYVPVWNIVSRVIRSRAVQTGNMKQEKGGCIIPAFHTETTALGITACRPGAVSWAGRSREGAEKRQRMTAALEKMPCFRAARIQPARWMEEKVTGDLGIIWSLGKTARSPGEFLDSQVSFSHFFFLLEKSFNVSS